MKVALITGITGQDGAYLAEFLIKKGYMVHGIKRRSSLFNTDRVDHIYEDPHIEGNRFKMHYGDLTDSTNLIRIIQEVQPDEIYNLGAMSHVHVSFEIPEFTAETNAIGVLNILEAVRALVNDQRQNNEPETRFYQASTSELYGKVQEVPQNEKTPFYPRSPYGVAKLYAYWITVNYRESYGLHASNGILFNHESPRRGEQFVTRKITAGLARLFAGIQPFPIQLGNLDAKRDQYFERMKTQPGADVDIEVGMVHPVQTPQPRRMMEGDVLEIDRQVEHEEAKQRRDRQPQIEKMEQADALPRRIERGAHRRPGEQEPHQQRIGHDDAEDEARHRVSADHVGPDPDPRQHSGDGAEPERHHRGRRTAGRVHPLLQPTEQDHADVRADESGDGSDVGDARVGGDEDQHQRGAHRVLDPAEPVDPRSEVSLVHTTPQRCREAVVDRGEQKEERDRSADGQLEERRRHLEARAGRTDREVRGDGDGEVARQHEDEDGLDPVQDRQADVPPPQ